MNVAETNDAHCVLCQQDLDHAARRRLKQFEAFVASTTERELREARERFAQLRRTFVELKTTNDGIDETIREVRIEHEAVADSISEGLAVNEALRASVALALSNNADLASDCPVLVLQAGPAHALADQIEEQVRTLWRSQKTHDRGGAGTARPQGPCKE